MPYFDENFEQVGERAARGEDGKTYYVPENMTYKEWEKRFINNSNISERQTNQSVTNYIVRSHTPGQDIANEDQIVKEVILSMPQKVRDALEQGTIIDIGKEGASQYDYAHDILYVAKGADKTEVIHEIGHMVKNKLLDAQKVLKLKEELLQEVMPSNFVQEVYYDAAQNPVEIYLIKSDDFVSDYQGRVYISDWSELLDAEMRIRPELLAEFISEPFREYIENPKHLEKAFPEFYEMIKRGVE